MYLLLDKIWYGNHRLKRILGPLSLVYRLVVAVRRWYLQSFCQIKFQVPLIVVGNITVGGVGKTPLVIELANRLREKGLEVGIVSRGYGASIKNFPYEVQSDDTAEQVGDEPLLIAQKTQCPVVISPKRSDAVEYLLTQCQSQIIISDDGLQHYRMGRAIEIAVIDGTRGLGNGLCLPAGPLREPPKRLKEVDFIVVNQGNWENAYSMVLSPGKITQLNTGKEVDPQVMNKTWKAIAAIGNPQRFYSTLSQLGIEFDTCSYPDHYQFKPSDLDYLESFIIMSEKDAVKCRSFSSETMYYLPVNAVLEDAFWNALWSHQQLKGYY
jgi:tetraacyldisaccharide 4'-kinase